jgi:branched-chain amino acid transport system ATP-binding protein
MTQLDVRNLSISFEGLKAVNNLSLCVEPASILGLIGPNGAGKTTVLNCITRFYQPDAGEIRFDGIDILSLKPSDIIRVGIARTFQNMELFLGLTVIDNILVGKHKFLSTGFFGTAFRFPRAMEVEKSGRKEAYETMEYLGIRMWESHHIGDLPFGIRRMVEIARALISKPKLLLLDEPTSGMMPHEKAVLLKQIQKLSRELKFSILLVEHDISFVTKMCQKILVMNFGSEIALGAPDEIINHPEVITAYIGKD